MSFCKGCGVEIDWVQTANGKKVPVEKKRLNVVTDQGQVVVGRVSHFSTCPMADQFRKNKGGARNGKRA